MVSAVAKPPVERRVVLEGISWGLYQQLLTEVEEGHLRFTYDEGRLEIMSPLPVHERVKTILGRLIEAFSDETGILLEGFGSTTFSRKDLLKGLEPDECYYVQNAAKVIGKETFDWTIDPPPDLAIEVDISRPEVARQPIYAALGVPEIWRYDGRAVVPLHRVAPERPSQGARYVAAEHSLAFPRLPMEELNRLLQIGLREGQTAAVKAMRTWCRSTLATPPDP
jgi:Uma2 family endonuclease